MDSEFTTIMKVLCLAALILWGVVYSIRYGINLWFIRKDEFLVKRHKFLSSLMSAMKKQEVEKNGKED